MAFEDDLFDDYDEDDIDTGDLDNGSDREDYDYGDDLFDPTMETDDSSYGYAEDDSEGPSLFTAEDDYDSIFSVSGY